LGDDLLVLGCKNLVIGLIFIVLVVHLLEDLVHSLKGEEPLDFGVNDIFLLSCLWLHTVILLVLHNVFYQLLLESVFELEQVEECVHGENNGCGSSNCTED